MASKLIIKNVVNETPSPGKPPNKVQYGGNDAANGGRADDGKDLKVPEKTSCDICAVGGAKAFTLDRKPNSSAKVKGLCIKHGNYLILVVTKPGKKLSVYVRPKRVGGRTKVELDLS